MGTIFKLLVAALVLNAAAQAGMAALQNYQFVDSVHEAMLFSPNAADQDIVAQIANLAASQGIPVKDEDISISHLGADVIFQTSYQTTVTLIPGVYKYTWTFEPNASVRSLRAIPLPHP